MVERGEPLRRLLGDEEAGVGHAEGLEDLPLEVVVEPIPGHDLDQAPDDVRREAVVPVGPRVEFQRVLRQQGRDLLERHAALLRFEGLRELVVDRMARKEPTREARRVHEDIAHIHGAARSHLGDRAVGLHLTHPEAAPLGDEAVDGIGELEEAALVELHQGDGRDGLGHGEDPKDGVVAQGTFLLTIHQSERPVVGRVPAAHDGDLAAGDLPRRHVVLFEVVGDPLQAGFAHPCRFGLDLHACLVPPPRRVVALPVGRCP